MRYLLDTNICINLMCGRSEATFRRLRRLGTDAAGISSVTLAELRYGACKSQRPVYHLSLIASFCAPLDIAAFDAVAAAVYGSVRAELENAGTPIGPLGMLIAAHALALDVTLVTANVREFQRVNKLRVETW